MPGEWSGLGSPLPGLGIPGIPRFGGLFGGGQSNPLGTAGGVLGSVVGGPVGGLLGNLGGGFLGSVFGLGNSKPSRPRSSYFYDFDADRAWLNQSKGLDEETKGLFRSVVEPIGQTAESLLGTLGLEPIVPGFSFGNFQNRVGFLLPGDEWATNPGKGSAGPGKEFYGPNVWQVIGPDRYQPSFQDVRAFGTSEGGRTEMPTPEAILQASQAALDALVLPAIQQAGLTNADIFGKFGLPTAQDEFASFLQQYDPNFSFGSALDFAAPAQFSVADLMAAQQLGGLRSVMPGLMPQTQQTQLPVGIGPGGPNASDAAFFKQAFGFNPWTETDPTNLAAQLRALLGGLS